MAKLTPKGAHSLSPHGRTYKLIELVGTSDKSYEDAIQKAIDDASRTLKGLAWFEVAELRGRLDDGKVAEWQATVKIGFRILGAARG